MKSTHKFHLGNAIPRMVLVGISLIFQVGWILLTIFYLHENFPWIEGVTHLLSLIVVLHINSKPTAAAYKMPWIMLFLAVPVMGLSLYCMMELFGDLGRMKKRLKTVRSNIRTHLTQDPSAARSLSESGLPASDLHRYLWQQARCPVYQDTSVRYYNEASEAFQSMKADLESAQSFIFMEYFIVSGESAFQEVADILIRKARQGVDIRFMYDDVGSVGNVNMFFAKRLADSGIRCMIFNPALPVLNLFMNHRDHRKITVIDGRIGYTGGYNLSDEYFGRKITYGRWKDTGIRMEGLAVKSLTAAFLEIWNSSIRTPEDPSPFLVSEHRIPAQAGFVQPYGDDPTSRERTAESVYLNLIYAAQKSLYVITPYLIITDEMNNALALAAKRGVDVRIITPGIPDKKTVYAITRSYYAGLASQGVRIYEYTPGFCHAKQMLCDGTTASIGTSNLDYRSLYLHFENNVLLYGGEAVTQIARDFEEIFPQCEEVTEKYRSGRSAALRLGQYILRLFAPLL